MRPIFRIWPGHVRSKEAFASVADLPVVDVPAIIAEGSSLREREIACSRSHAAVMRAFLETDAPFCVALEDDAILGPDRQWMEFTDFDLFIPFASNRKKIPADTTIVPAIPKYGMQAYVASRRFAEAFIPLLEAGGVADHVQHAASRGMKVGSFAGNIVRHDTSATSLISDGRRKWFLAQEK